MDFANLSSYLNDIYHCSQVNMVSWPLKHKIKTPTGPHRLTICHLVRVSKTNIWLGLEILYFGTSITNRPTLPSQRTLCTCRYLTTLAVMTITACRGLHLKTVVANNDIIDNTILNTAITELLSSWSSVYHKPEMIIVEKYVFWLKWSESLIYDTTPRAHVAAATVCPLVSASKPSNGLLTMCPNKTLFNLSAGRDAQYFLQWNQPVKHFNRSSESQPFSKPF